MMKRNRAGRVLETRAAYALEKGRLQDAELAARRALATDPSSARAMQILGEIALRNEDAETAADFLGQAVAASESSPPPAWRFQLGEALIQTGKFAAAAQALRDGLAGAPDEITAWTMFAKVLYQIGDRNESMSAWRRVSALDPDSWIPMNDLGIICLEIRDWDGAGDALGRAQKLAPEEPIVAINRAMLAEHRGDTSGGIALLSDWSRRFPDHAALHAALGFMLADAGRADEAATALQRAVEIEPEDGHRIVGLGHVLIESGRAPEAASLATRFQRTFPSHCGALAIEALAAVALGDQEGVARFFDYENLVSAQRLSIPPGPPGAAGIAGFADLEAFNVALAAHAATHPTLMDTVGYATRKGKHSGLLLIDPPAVVTAFEQAVWSAVQAYADKLGLGYQHAWIRGRPAAASMKMWCSVLESGGHQIAHIHPEGWLSGVYYPRVPDAIALGAGPDGWLAFGPPERAFASPNPIPTHRIRPEPGLLILFPSYLYHHTIGFDTPGERISVAFDIVPE